MRAQGRGGETGGKLGPHLVLFCFYLRLFAINVLILPAADIDNIDYSVFRYSGFAVCEGRIGFEGFAV